METIRSVVYVHPEAGVPEVRIKMDLWQELLRTLAARSGPVNVCAHIFKDPPNPASDYPHEWYPKYEMVAIISEPDMILIPGGHELTRHFCLNDEGTKAISFDGHRMAQCPDCHTVFIREQ